MKILVDKMPKKAEECLFAEPYLRASNESCEYAMCLCFLRKYERPFTGNECYLSEEKECPFLKAGEQE